MEASNLTEELTNLTHRVSFLEEENRWLKSQLFGRSSEKRPQDIAVEQQRLFNEQQGSRPMWSRHISARRPARRKSRQNCRALKSRTIPPRKRRFARTMARPWRGSAKKP